MFKTRKRLAEHFFKLGIKNHPYVLEMKKNKGDNPKTSKIEAEVEVLKEADLTKEIEEEESK